MTDITQNSVPAIASSDSQPAGYQVPQQDSLEKNARETHFHLLMDSRAAWGCLILLSEESLVERQEGTWM